MAKLKGNFGFTGKLGNLSAYTMRGSDDIILRGKGGPTKKQIETSRNFRNTRRGIVEFGGRSTASKLIRQMLHPQKALADYNISGPLNALIRPIQKMDMAHEWGQRDICISKNPKLLEGFNLNRRVTFDSIVRNPVTYELSRDSLTASVSIPALLPGINFFTPGKYPLYSFIIVLGIVPDILHDQYGYKPSIADAEIGCQMVISEWYPVSKGSPLLALEAALPVRPANELFSVILSVGIQFGTPVTNNHVEQIKKVGAAKIIGMA